MEHQLVPVGSWKMPCGKRWCRRLPRELDPLCLERAPAAATSAPEARSVRCAGGELLTDVRRVEQVEADVLAE